jgi:nitrate reductase NapA
VDAITDPKPTSLAGKAKIFFRPYAAPVEQPDANYDLWLCTGRDPGALAHRQHDAPRAGAAPHPPTAVLYMHPADAEKRGVKRNDLVWIESRRGKVQVVVDTKGRNAMPKGTVFAAFFDENAPREQAGAGRRWTRSRASRTSRSAR